jgi:hypothetical protein
MGANYLKRADWNAECDTCGFKFKASQLRKTGDKNKPIYVCKKCYDPYHPQDDLRGVPDNPSVAWTRPPREETIIIYHGDESDEITFSSDETIHEWNVALTEGRVAILLKNGAVAGDRIIIYKTGSGDKTLYVASELLDAGTSV